MNSLSPSLRRAGVLPFLAAAITLVDSAPAAVLINELDCDQVGTDAAEFVEFYNTDTVNAASLNGHVLVFYNGSNDLSYFALDLDGLTIPAGGYVVVGNVGVPNVAGAAWQFAGNLLQNGQDAVALILGEPAAFPNGTAVTTANLVDAVVYDTSDADDPGLLVLVTAGGQVDENANTASATESIARVPNGAGGARNLSAFVAQAPTPGLSNVVSESLTLSFVPATFDESDGAGAATGTVTRTGPTTAALTVTLTNPDPSEITIPTSVVIPIGQASAPFAVDAVNDGWNDGTQVVSITATATGFAPGSSNVNVNDEGDPAALLVVNEVHATGRGDANGDGTNTNFGLDEFVEIVNISAAVVDLSGWTLRDAAGLADAGQIRHTFPASSFLNPGCAVVIFGGGNPAAGRTAAFGNAWVVKANGNAVNGLSLNDTGDVVSLQNATGEEQAGVTYGTILAADNTKSLSRNPDLTGPNVLVPHTNVPGAGAALYSPGTKVDGTKFCTLTESFTLTLTPSSVVENSGAHTDILTVSRPAPGTATVYVMLTTSDPGEATAAASSLTFGAGVLSMNVTVNAIDDELLDGTQIVTFTAMGEGYLNGTGTLSVTDDGTDIPLAALYINELDCDQSGSTDAREFIELYDGGIGNKLMDGFLVVLWNGFNDQSYRTMDLAGLRTNAQGYFVVGSAAVPGVGLVIPDGTLQNGADAVAVHQSLATAFPNGTPVTAANLIDAVVYGIAQPDDTGLLDVLTPGKLQAAEGANSSVLALARRPNATSAFQPGQFVTQSPTPGMSNVTGTSYGIWSLDYPGLGAPDADPDMDGLPNRLEFGLGTDPLQPNASGIPAPSVVGGFLRFTLNKGLVAGNDPGTLFVPEVSTDLVNWSSAGVTVVTDSTSTLIFDYTGTALRIMMRTRVVVP